MDSMEKQPLIEQENQAPPTLEDLSTRVTEARGNAQTAQRELFTAQRAYQTAWARTPKGRVTRTLLFSFLFLLTALPLCSMLYAIASDDDFMDDEYLPRRVPLEAHIMSKCPDARDCLHDLILPAMVKVSHSVDFKLSYIGT